MFAPATFPRRTSCLVAKKNIFPETLILSLNHGAKIMDDSLDPNADCDCDLENNLTNADEVVEVDNSPLPVTALAMPTGATIKYAPVQPTVKGNLNMICIALKWQNDSGANPSSVSNAGRQTAKIYADLSGGNIRFNVVAKQIAVPYNKAAKNINAAEKYAKNKVAKPNANKCIYAIVNHNAKGFSNAGGDTAHLLGTLIRDFCHEIGHLRPFSLGHSGAYKDGKLAPYDDGTSFMGRFSSSKLTGAQLYLLGWLPENKVGMYEVNDAATDFNVQNLYGDNTSDNSVKVVLIPRGENRPLYLSMPQVQNKPALCLHLSSGRGTQRITVFGNQATYEGITFQKVADGNGYVTVRVSTTN